MPISSEDYSSANVIKTEVGLKENFVSLIQKVKQESQKEVEVRQKIEQAHEKKIRPIII